MCCKDDGNICGQGTCAWKDSVRMRYKEHECNARAIIVWKDSIIWLFYSIILLFHCLYFSDYRLFGVFLIVLLIVWSFDGLKLFIIFFSEWCIFSILVKLIWRTNSAFRALWGGRMWVWVYVHYVCDRKKSSSRYYSFSDSGSWRASHGGTHHARGEKILSIERPTSTSRKDL